MSAKWRAVPIAALAGFLLAGAAHAQDPAQVVGSDQCAECHEAAHEVWEGTAHQEGWRTFHRSDSAQAILERMGLRSARRGVCVECHYTQAMQRGRERAVSGVSCESCHGGASEWLDVHNDFGQTAAGEKATAETESAEHRQMRMQRTAEMGMIRPDMPYELVRNCYSCHTVPQEELVNEGEHIAGSDFRIVERLDQVRHNFSASGGDTNRKAARTYDPQNRNRLLYVLGQMVNLEFALRGLAKASGPGDYAESMTSRAQAAMEKLQAVASAVPAAQGPIQEALSAAQGAELTPGNGALTGAAEGVKAAAQSFADQHDGSQLAGVDSMIGGEG